MQVEYIKPTKSYKLPKSVKRLMAGQANADLRHHFKNMMIQAELYAEVQAKELEEKRRKSKRNPNIGVE